MDPFIIGSLISGGASLAGGLLDKGPKIPAPKTAEQMKSDMDTMYTGTTPWERLGASGGGVPQASAAQDAAKIQARVQQQQHKNQMKIEAMKAAATLSVANINRDALLQKTDKEQGNSPLAQAKITETREKIQNLSQDTQIKVAQAIKAKEYAKVANLLAINEASAKTLVQQGLMEKLMQELGHSNPAARAFFGGTKTDTRNATENWATSKIQDKVVFPDMTVK